MNVKMIKLVSMVFIGTAFLIWGVLGPPIAADPGPSVSPGFTLGIFASVIDPFHLAFDSDGNLFAGRDNSGSVGSPATAARIHKISPGGVVVEFGPSIDDPDGVVVDIDGAVATLGDTVLVASLLDDGSGLSRITQISPDGSSYSTLIQGTSPILTNPQQLAFDSTGKLLWVNCGSPTSVDTVGFFDGTNLGVFGSVNVNTCLGGIAIGPDGQVFVSDFGNGTVKVLASDGTLLDPAFVTGLNLPDAMAFDTIGLFDDKLYVVERGNGQILSIDPDSGDTEVFATDFDGPFGLAFGPDGCLYVSEFNTDTVWKICSTTILVNIDIKPGSDPNCFNLNGHGVVPVAILGTADFNPCMQVDLNSLDLLGMEVRVRGKKGPITHCDDVNLDGYPDLVVQFEDDITQWEPGQSIADLMGNLLDGTPIIGSDSICVKQ